MAEPTSSPRAISAMPSTATACWPEKSSLGSAASFLASLASS